MTTRRLRCCLLLAASLSASVASAANSSPRVGDVYAPAGTEARARAALAKAVRRYVAEARLEEPLKGYVVAPSLVQLRRYVEGTPKQAKLVCLVDLALRDATGRVLATVQGRSSSQGATWSETIDAAARAAVSRLPSALHALAEGKSSSEVAAR